MKYEKESTIERLQIIVSPSYGAVVKYGEKVLVTDAHWQGGFEAAVYRFTDITQTDIEAPVQLEKIAPTRFEDAGHALEWAMELRAVVHVEGGLVQTVWANGAVDVAVYDLDESDFATPEEIEENAQKREQMERITSAPGWECIW